ncbi:MAG: hypothetical protein KGJ62_06650 [Armatimonadetes bacterium]|nr:hypothetical protein [Armatimonadota bacterium]MDE2207577.1 hypothetical protein [Armatimonadota bacterium]
MARLTPNFTDSAVRELSPDDLPALSRLFASDPTRFRSMEAGLDMYGLESPTVRFYCVPDGSGGRILGVLIQLRTTVVCADRDGECGGAIAAFVDEQPAVTGLRGCLETLGAVKARLRRYRPTHWEDSWFLELHSAPVQAPAGPAARRAVAQDVDAISALYASSRMMPRSTHDLDAHIATGRVFVVDDFHLRNCIAGAAMLNAEGRSACVIGSVYTRPEARGRGCATACTGAISRDIIDSGKLPCLFYENEAAGRIYHRLGFEPAGRWAILYVDSAR